jgi:MYXO-CTERM domain-containing protein
MRRTLLLGGVLAAAGISRPANAAVVWDGDAGKGTAVFGIIEDFNGPITVVDDPTYGKVFKIVCNDNGGTKARSEVSWMAGVILDRNGDYYVAWRSKWGPLPTKGGKWQVLSQIHHDPVGLGGPVPFGLAVPGDGMMHFNAQDPTGREYSMWDHSLPIDSWHRYVMHTKMGETLATGFCEIWFDGVKQTLTNGKDSIPCAMARPNAGSHWKWGVYRSGAGGAIGQSVHYLQHPIMGTTYEDVAEGGPSAADAGAPPATGGVDAADDAGGGGGGGSGGAGGGGSGGGAGGNAAGGSGGGEPPIPGGATPSPSPAAKGGGGCAVAGAGSPWPLLPLLFALAALHRRLRKR